MGKIRVLHIHTRLIRGGADENVLFTVNRLNPHRFEVGLAVGGGSEQSVLDLVAPHVRLMHVPDLVRELRPHRDLLALGRLRRLIRQGDYDIVHTHTAKAGMLGRLAARASATPIVVHTLHGSTFHDALGPVAYWGYRSLEKVAAGLTTSMVCVGNDLRQRYLAAGIGTPEQYEVILSGMELTAFETASQMSQERRAAVRDSLGVPAAATLVGKVARLEARKGYPYFFDLAERILARRPDVYFVGLGAGAEGETLRREVQRRGLESRVRLPGFRDDIAEVIASFDVAVLTSLWEGLPRVLVQAAACGVPAVTFDVEGAREVVKEGLNGFVVAPRNVEALTKRVAELIGDPTRAREMGRAGQQLVHEGWSVETMVCRIEALYESLHARRNGAAA